MGNVTEYREDNGATTVADEVWQWAVEAGKDPRMRIVVAGYEDGREVPPGWRVREWTASGGYAVTGNGEGKENRFRERLWCSPGCVGGTLDLFSDEVTE